MRLPGIRQEGGWYVDERRKNVEFMSMLVFFPWYCIPEKSTCGEFTLIPFSRGELPYGKDPRQGIIDKILEPYRDHSGRSISSATLVQMSGLELTHSLNEDQLSEVFIFGEVVGFVGLSQREFFLRHRSLSQEVFSVVAQRYADNGAGGSSIWVRRKDGNDINFISEDVFQVPCPWHVSITASVNMNMPLLEALLNSRDKDFWPLIEESIFGFNRANTDSPTVTQQAEIVLQIGAMERILDCRHGNEDDLAARIEGLFIPPSAVPVASCSRIPSDWKVQSVAEAWIRDCFRVRGNLGHGRKKSSYRSRWTIQEHLLLGAYFFPLLVKLLLAKSKLYDLSPDDERSIEVFESLACAKLFGKETKPDGTEEWPWSKIRSDMLLMHLVEKVIKRK